MKHVRLLPLLPENRKAKTLAGRAGVVSLRITVRVLKRVRVFIRIRVRIRSLGSG